MPDAGSPLRASVGSTEASDGRLARFGVIDRLAKDRGSDLRSMGLGKQPPTRGSRTDHVSLIDDQAPSDIEPGGRQPEREPEHEREQGERVRHHLADGWPILLLLTPTPILPHPEADLERQEDDRHSGQEDARDRE